MEKYIVSITARHGCGYDRTVGRTFPPQYTRYAFQGKRQPAVRGERASDCDEEIRKINLEFRGIDAPTDVLSFPMQELKADSSTRRCAKRSGNRPRDAGRYRGLYREGMAQSIEYEHLYQKELSYLSVHSVLHLLGYDHMEEEDKRKMREREKEIIASLRN
jgi:rRNA maturation RNase YbeY